MKTKQRTPRLRYLEPPTEKDGNPFFALRVPAGLLKAFKARAVKSKCTPTGMVRAYMAKVSGYKLSGAK